MAASINEESGYYRYGPISQIIQEGENSSSTGP
jgi:hypothetical protein